MKGLNIFLALLLIATSAFGENFAVKPLTPQELNARKAVRDGEPWTFETQTFDKDKVFYTGLLKPKKADREEVGEYVAAGEIKSKVSLPTLTEFPPVYDQGSCGSCVYNAVAAAYNINLRLRGQTFDLFSRQYLMSCGSRDSMCNGSWFEIVAGDLVKFGGLPLESDYPYTASNAACKGRDYTLRGQIKSKSLIQANDRSLMGYMSDNLQSVPVTIGAGGAFMNYRSGVFNACSNVGTNHQMVVVGYEVLPEALDANGKVIFDANGNVAPGKLILDVLNSWNVSWGDKGHIRMVARDSRGNRCNNIGEEYGILDTGLAPPTPPTPPNPPTPPGPGPEPTPVNIPWYFWLIVVGLGAGLVLAIVLKRK